MTWTGCRVIALDEDSQFGPEVVGSLLQQLYLARHLVPPQVLLPAPEVHGGDLGGGVLGPPLCPGLSVHLQ